LWLSRKDKISCARETICPSRTSCAAISDRVLSLSARAAHSSSASSIETSTELRFSFSG
jgi:hypothetical protein